MCKLCVVSIKKSYLIQYTYSCKSQSLHDFHLQTIRQTTCFSAAIMTSHGTSRDPFIFMIRALVPICPYSFYIVILLLLERELNICYIYNNQHDGYMRYPYIYIYIYNLYLACAPRMTGLI
jgi:hypothetical protein